MITLYAKCGKCGKFSPYAAPEEGRINQAVPPFHIAARDRTGQMFWLRIPETWVHILINNEEFVLCGDCTPEVIKEVKRGVK